MRKALLIIAAFSLLVASGVFAAEKATTSKITSVTVYPDRALVIREATIPLSPGLHKLVLSDLAGGIDDESIRGWGKGTAKVKLLGLNILRQELPRPSDEEIRRLEDKLEKLGTQIETAEQEKDILGLERTYLKTLVKSFIAVFNPGILSGDSAGARLAGTESLVKRRMQAIAKSKIEIKVRIRKLKRERSKVTEELNKLRHPGQSRKKALTVDIECKSGGSFTLGFSYIMRNAGWTPMYDIRAESHGEKIEIVSKAQVRQRTGEDWTGVGLVLSTAAPQIGGDMPEPQPRVLDFASEYAKKRRRIRFPMGGAGPASKAKAGLRAEAAPEPMPGAVAEVVTGETAVEFRVKKRKDISADGKPHIVPIGRDSFTGETRYLAAPIESPYAYLQAKVKNTSERSFLAGGANVFMSGKFVGQARLPLWAQGEKIDVPLGIDEGISIERKLISKKTDSLLGKTTVSYEWRIKVANNTGRSAILRLYEPIPQSRNSDINVKVTLNEPEPTRIGHGGRARWDMDLAAGDKKTIKLGYRVKYPSSKRVENLP